MRKLEIVYLNTVVKDAKCLVSMNAKRYNFLTAEAGIKEGDIIVPLGQVRTMVVLSIEENYEGDCILVGGKSIPLTVLYLCRSGNSSNAWVVSKTEEASKRYKKEDSRSLNITLNQARQWYRGNDRTLKQIALAVYSEKELELTVEKALSWIEKKVVTITVPSAEVSKATVLGQWASLAKFFNGDWKMKAGRTGYFLGRQCYPFEGDPFLGGCNLPNFIKVSEHNTVMYPGLVYFKNKEDIFKAANLMKDSLAAMFD